MVLAAMLFVFADAAGSAAQAPQPIHADVVIPKPTPQAPLADWTAARGRMTTSLSANGATLRGWSYAGTDPKAATIVFFNSNGTTIDRNDALYRALAALGPSVVVYDYRGYGFSQGLAGVHVMQQDAVRIVDVVAREAGGRGVVVYGFSLGAAIAAYAAANTTVAGVILAAPFASAQEELPIALTESGVPASTASTLTPAQDAIDALGVADFARSFQAPLLILHGTADTDVPIAQGREVYSGSVSTPKRIVELDGVNHAQTLMAPEARAAVRAFVLSLEH